MLASPQDYEVVAFLGLVLIFEVWERLRPAREIDRWADLKIDVLSFALAVAMNRVSTYTVTSFFEAVAPKYIVGSTHALQALPGSVKIVLSVFMADFVIYWIHRAQHHFEALWRTHAWHHSVEHLYWFSGFRTSFLHSFIYNIPQAAIPMLVFRLDLIQTSICYSVGLLIQFWEHTNFRVNVGRLAWLIITPDYHRIHHSATRYSRMNLGTTFSIWDRMFGTYVDPATVPDSLPLGLGEKLDRKKIRRMLLGV